MHMLKKLFIFSVLLLCVGCAQISAHSFDSSQHDIKEVCVQPASQRIPANFKYILKERLLHHNVIAKSYKSDPDACAYRLLYRVKAKVKNKTVFLKDVHLALYEGEKQIAYADRDAPNGFFGKEVGDLSKWDSTRSVVDALVDQLFGPSESMRRSDMPISVR